MNIVISDPKTRRAYSKKVDEVPAAFLNRKIGQIVSLDTIGLDGFEARISGGSDTEGFAMHPTLEGSNRKKIFSHSGVGFKKKTSQERRRKSVRGNTVFKDTSQLNLAIVKGDSERLRELFGGAPKTDEKKKSFKDEMVEKSLAGVGDDSVIGEAKTIKIKPKH